MGRLTHGEAARGKETPEHRAWRAMKRRCDNPHCSQYADYGGRGIRVCERWSRSYPAFLADMGRKPSPHHSLDRIRVNGDYEPGNVRWATREQQISNTRRPLIVLTVNGETLPVAEWAARSGIAATLIYERLRKGWTPEAAVYGRTRERHRPLTSHDPRLQPRTCERCGQSYGPRLDARGTMESPARYSQRRFCGIACSGAASIARAIQARKAARAAKEGQQ